MSKLRCLVANNIKEARGNAGLTQEAVAEKSGIHYKYYQRIETGTVNLTLDSLEKLAKALGVKPRKLIG